MSTSRFVQCAGIAVAVLSLAVCAGSGTTASPTSPSTTATTTTTGLLPAIYGKFGNGVQVSLSGDTVVISTADLPDHPSPYFGVGNASYEAPQAGMAVNPNRIAAQSITFRIPLSPAKASPGDTPMGAMGIATNGVTLFNQYAAGRVPLAGEILSFDRYNGHPTPQSEYHYHVEPLWLTAKGKAVFVGVLLDGFPVYGPQDADGSVPSSLDSCNGHVGTTSEFPAGIYHYHVTSAPPYIAGCFYGTPGTVTGG